MRTRRGRGTWAHSPNSIERGEPEPAYKIQLDRISSLAESHARKLSELELGAAWRNALVAADTPASVARVCVAALQKIRT